MFIYWSLILIPILAVFSPISSSKGFSQLQLALYGLFLIIIIGLRHEVGGDWFGYIDNYARIGSGDFSSINYLHKDFGYEVLYWFSMKYLNGIYAVNLVCALFFVSGLIRFSRTLPFPWIALLVAIPILVIIVSMGYTRQSAAVGLLLHALVYLVRGKILFYYVLVAFGALFHKSVLGMLPIGFLYHNETLSFLKMAQFSSLVLLSISILAFEELQRLLFYYVYEPIHDSSGAWIRVVVNSFSAFLFLYFKKDFEEKYKDAKLWLIFSMVSISLIPMVFLISTFTDRIAIFFLPLQLVVLSRVPTFIKLDYNRAIFVSLVIGLYASLMFIWFNFGGHSHLWLPYKNYLLQ